MGDFGDFANKVRKMNDSMENSIDKEVGEETISMANTAKRNLAQNNSVTANDPLVSRVYARKISRPEHFTAYAAIAPSDYAKFLEYGTGIYGKKGFDAPSAPPTMQIYIWIVTKGIQPRSEGIDDQWGLANAIAKTIETYGNKPHPFMIPAFRQHRPRYVSSVSAAISKSVRRHT